jgi:hypothetical protein
MTVELLLTARIADGVASLIPAPERRNRRRTILTGDHNRGVLTLCL